MNKIKNIFRKLAAGCGVALGMGAATSAHADTTDIGTTLFGVITTDLGIYLPLIAAALVAVFAIPAGFWVYGLAKKVIGKAK